MAKSRQAKPVTDVLTQVFQDRHWQKKMAVNRVFLFWDEVVGKEIADLAQPDVVTGGVLWVFVPDSIWMQQLHFLKHDLLERINQRLRADCHTRETRADVPKLDDIRFKISRDDHRPRVEAAAVETSEAPVDPQREQDFNLLIKSIKNEELRSMIKRLWRNLEKRLD